MESEEASACGEQGQDEHSEEPLRGVQGWPWQVGSRHAPPKGA